MRMGCISSKKSRRNSLELDELVVKETENMIGLNKRQRWWNWTLYIILTCYKYSTLFACQVSSKGFLERNQQRVAGNRSQAFHTVSWDWESLCLVVITRGFISCFSTKWSVLIFCISTECVHFLFFPPQSVLMSFFPTKCVHVLISFQLCSCLVFRSCFSTKCVHVFFSYQVCSCLVFLPS